MRRLPDGVTLAALRNRFQRIQGRRPPDARHSGRSTILPVTPWRPGTADRLSSIEIHREPIPEAGYGTSVRVEQGGSIEPGAILCLTIAADEIFA